MSEITTIGDRPVATLIGSEVRTTTADASLHDVADLLTREDISALVVEDAGSDATAVVTERDLVRALAERLDPASTTVGQVASTELIWCDAGARIADVALRMTEDYVRHVLVEDDGDLVGIVSARDVLGAYAGS